MLPLNGRFPHAPRSKLSNDLDWPNESYRAGVQAVCWVSVRWPGRTRAVPSAGIPSSTDLSLGAPPSLPLGVRLPPTCSMTVAMSGVCSNSWVPCQTVPTACHQQPHLCSPPRVPPPFCPPCHTQMAVGFYIILFCLTFMFFRSAGDDDDDRKPNRAAEPNVA